MVASQDPPGASKTGDGDLGGGFSSDTLRAQSQRVKSAKQVLQEYEARIRARERQHLESCGKQVHSFRRTEPMISFAAPRGCVVQERASKARCPEISEHPSAFTPGPTYTAPPSSSAPTIVLKGWGRERRFEESPLALQGSVSIKSSTNASPFSSTFPYEDTGLRELLQDSQASHVTSYDFGSIMSSPRERQTNPQAMPDLNCLHIKYPARPSYSFGSAGLGFRFKRGTKFSRIPPTSTTSRLLGFRELREAVVLR